MILLKYGKLLTEYSVVGDFFSLDTFIKRHDIYNQYKRKCVLKTRELLESYIIWYNHTKFVYGSNYK